MKMCLWSFHLSETKLHWLLPNFTSVTATCHCPVTHKTNLLTMLSRPHLPPIWPLEETWWVRGWVAHHSFGKTKMVVVATESLRRFGQAESVHRPRRGWPSPRRSNSSGACLRLSHLGVLMRRLFERQVLLDYFLTVVLCFCFQLCSPSTKRQLSTGDTSGYAAMTVSTMLRLSLVWCDSNPVENNGMGGTMKMTIYWNGASCFIPAMLQCQFQANKAKNSKCTCWEQLSFPISFFGFLSVGPLLHDTKQTYCAYSELILEPSETLKSAKQQ